MNHRLFILVIFCFISNANLILAQDGFGQYYTYMAEAAKQKDYPKAIEWAEKAIPLAEETLGKDTKELGTFWNNVAKFYQSDEKWDKAEAAFLNAINTRKAALGEKSTEYAKSMASLAFLYFYLERFEQSEPLYIKALEILKETVGESDKDYINTANTFADLEQKLKKSDTASTIKVQNIETVKSTYGEASPEYAKALFDLAYTDFEKERYTEAEQNTLKAVNIWESNQIENKEYQKAIGMLAFMYFKKFDYINAQKLNEKALTLYSKNSNNPKDYWYLISNLSNCYLETENYTKSEKLFLELINHFESDPKAKEEEQALYVSSLTDLAYLYMKDNRLNDAEKYFKLAMSLKKDQNNSEDNEHMLQLYLKMGDIEKAQLYVLEKGKSVKAEFGENSLEYGKSLMELGIFYENQEDFKQAEASYRTASNIFKDNFGLNTTYYESIIQISRIYLIQSRYKEAEGMMEEVMAFYNKNNDRGQNYFQALNYLTEIYYQTGKFIKAEPHLTEIVAYWEKNQEENIKSYARSLRQLAGIELELNKLYEAEQHFEKALSLYKKTFSQSDPSYIFALNDLAVLYQKRSAYQEAENLLLEATQIAKTTFGDNNLDYAFTLQNLSILYRGMGRYSESENYCLEALSIRQSLLEPTSIEFIEIQNDLALLLEIQGKYADAEPIFQNIIETYSSSGLEKNAAYAKTLYFLGKLHKTMGRYADAEQNFKEALEVQSKLLGNQHPDYAETLNGLAVVFKILKRKEDAEALYLQAIEIQKNSIGENSPSYAASLDNLAAYYLGLKEFDKAEPLYKQALEIRKNTLGASHPAYAASLNNLALLYELSNQPSLSEPLYAETIRIFKNVLGVDHPDYALSLFNLASLYEQTNQFVKAQPYYIEASEIAIKQIEENFSSLSEEEKKQFYNAHKLFFERLMLFSVNVFEQQKVNKQLSLDIIGEALNLRLATKGILLNATSKIRKRIMESGNQQLKDQYKEWQELREKISKLFSSGKSEDKSAILNLQEKVNQIEKQLSAQSNEFTDAFVSEKITWQDIQKKLNDKEAVIELIKLVPNKDTTLYAAFIITSKTVNSPEVVILSNGKDLENKYLNYFKNKIRAKEEEDKYSYQQFWEPLGERLKGIEKVYISPDGVYNQINLNAMKVANSDKYLIDEFQITLLTNIKDLITLNDKSSSTSKKALLMGNPTFRMNTVAKNDTEVDLDNQQNNWLADANFATLPGTAKEVAQIGNILKQNQYQTEVYVESQAVEENIKNATDLRVLHIATHGFFLPTSTIVQSKENKNDEEVVEKIKVDPMLRSGLVLAGVSDYAQNPTKQKEDGVITAYEMMNLSLDQTELVVLSACETGLGKVQTGEGVYGFQRAFKIAGADTILMSLWKVDDEATQQLMENMYSFWLQGETKIGAFQKAQQKIRTVHPHPYYWGAFVMFGE